MRLVLLLLLPLLAGMQCSSSSTLSEDEMEKLDPALRHLLEQEGDESGPFEYVTSRREEDGTTVYAVTLRAEEPGALEEAGLPLGSVFGEIATARLSLEEIKEAARLEAVRGIRNSEQDLQPQPPEENSP